MDEIINISVNGYSLTKDGNCAGTQGDCNSTKLRITFGENWSEYAKSITFWNALGENPVKLQLGTDLLEDILTSYDVYLVPIPGEAMTEEGTNSFVIEGSIDGKVKRSVEGNLKVLYSPKAENAGDPESVTPTLAEQVRAEIDEIKGDIAIAEQAARHSAEARVYAASAKESLNTIEGMTVSSETLEAGTQASVKTAYVGDNLNMHFGIPAGESGVHMGADEPTDPDIKVWLDTSGDADEALTAKRLNVDGTEMYVDEYGEFVIKNPQRLDDNGMPINLEGKISLGDNLSVNGNEVYHTGNLKDLTVQGNYLDGIERNNFMRNTWLDDTVAELVKEIHTNDEQETASLDDELAYDGEWITDGWEGDIDNGFTHTSGNTNPLTFVLPEGSAGTTYQISFRTTVGMNETPNLTVCVGDSEPFDLYGQVQPVSVGIMCVNGGNVEFRPDTNFTGTVYEISIRAVLWGCDSALKVTDSWGNESFAIRATRGAEDPEDSTNHNGENNAFLGVYAGYNNTSGYGNVALGALALKNNTSGFWNSAIGNRALEKNTVGSRNIALGYGALQENVYGKRNIAIGSYSLMYAENCSWNISIGADAQMNRTSGDGNVSVGFTTLNSNSGGYNTALGYGAMYSSSTSDYCVSVGWNAGYKDAGDSNVNIGGTAGYQKSSGNGNVFVGHGAGKGTSTYTTEYNVAIGYEAGGSLATGSSNNTLIGYRAGKNITTGKNNVIIGQACNADSATAHYQLNIGNLLKGSMQSTNRYLLVNGGLQLPKIPTTDPVVAGAVWSDNGTLKVSAG